MRHVSISRKALEDRSLPPLLRGAVLVSPANYRKTRPNKQLEASFVTMSAVV